MKPLKTFAYALTLGLSLFLGAAAPLWANDSQPAMCPLVSIRQRYFTNCMSSMEHARMSGDMEVETSITGLGGEAAATMQYELEGKFDLFESVVGFSASAPDSRSCTFELWADNALVTKVGPLKATDAPDILRGNIKGARMITLRMVPSKYNGTAGAMWGDPKLYAGMGDKQFDDTLILHVNGELLKVTPSKVHGQTRIMLPFNLQPGRQEYKISTDYDAKEGRVDIEYKPLESVATPYSAPQ